MANTLYICDLCGREVSNVTEHHLIPKQLGGRKMNTATLCATCHKQIHALYTNKYLSTRLYTIDLLKNDVKIKRYLKFISNYPGDYDICIKKSKDIRRQA
ncbi:HNH endonuclease [Inconstantimicrobium mannanitabidum]|uniref:Uncharacterized protein n=1 Tax=Inconstantimicrobium mannanitabidum TaxID=1604901 RepID=A0ACB5R794_9CLOT|nr:HNH endonuclease [Clostridium sp. TW13]GKX64831.1 hypothetical protein rsdtw13_00890 [Clostridium sp. TW13]